MKNIFISEKELSPKIKLCDLIEKGKAGGTPGDISFSTINDMTKQGKYINYTEKHISKEGLENSSAWLVPENSLLYSMYASIGFVSINKIPLTTNQAIYSIIPKKEILLEYLYYYLTFFQKKLYKYVETGTQGNINAKIVKNLPITVPGLDKQKKIAEFLSLIDKKLDLTKKTINELKEYKKYLLQNMFC